MEVGPRGGMLRRVGVVLVLLAGTVAALGLTGCRGRQSMMSEDVASSPMLSVVSAGRRTAFVDEQGEVLLKLRRRKARTRVFGADRVPIGDVLRDGQTFHLLRRDHQSGYIIAPFEEDDADADSPGGEGDRHLTFLVHEARVPLPPAEGEASEKGSEGGSGQGEAASSGRIGRLSRLVADGGAPVARLSMTATPTTTLWRIYRREDELLLEIEGSTEAGAGRQEARVYDGEEVEATYVLSVVEDPHRRRVLALPQEQAEKPDAVPVLAVRDRKLTALAVAPLLVSEMEPLLRGGMIEVLSER